MKLSRMVVGAVAIFALCLFAVPQTAVAQIPQLISYQGVLATATDPPELVADGDYDLVFRLYDVETGGTALWSEAHITVPVEEGRFHVMLGRGLPFSNIAFNKPYWLGITVGSGTELPRIELSASPYCLTARRVADSAITSLSIKDGTIKFEDIAQNDAEEGDVIVWDGEAWVPGSGGTGPDCTGCDDRFVNVTGDEIGGTLSIVRPADDPNLLLKRSTNETVGWIEANESSNRVTYQGNAATHDFKSGGAAFCALFDADVQVTGDLTATGAINGDIDHGGLMGLADNDHPQYVLDAGDLMTGTLTIKRPSDAANVALQASDGTERGYIQADESASKITYHANNGTHEFEGGGAAVCASFDAGVSVTGDIAATGSITGSIDHGGLDGLADDDHPQYVTDAGDLMTGTLTLKKPVGAANVVLQKSDGTEFGYIQAEEASDSITYHGNDKIHNFESGSAAACAVFDGNVEVAGDLCATGTIGACSDDRYKKDVHTVTCALESVQRLRGVTYRWRKGEFPDKKFDGEVHHGFIAQEIQQILPDVVHEDSKGYLSVDYSRVTPLLVEAIKEQQKEIDELRAMIEQLLASK